MKRFLTFNLLLVLGLSAFQCVAKRTLNDEQNEFDKAIVTLKDGSVLNGIVTKYWTDNYMSRYNTEFTLTDNKGVDVKITVEDLDSIIFPMRSDDHLKVWRVYNFAQLIPLSKEWEVKKWIAGDGIHSEHAQVVVPTVRICMLIANPFMMGGQDYWTTSNRACLKVENDTIAYPFYFSHDGGLSLKYLKLTLGKTRPELVTHIEKWFKADKKRKKKLKKNFAIILEAVEDYYKKTDN